MHCSCGKNVCALTAPLGGQLAPPSSEEDFPKRDWTDDTQNWALQEDAMRPGTLQEHAHPRHR